MLYELLFFLKVQLVKIKPVKFNLGINMKFKLVISIKSSDTLVSSGWRKSPIPTVI